MPVVERTAGDRSQVAHRASLLGEAPMTFFFVTGTPTHWIASCAT
jgi:hypothetical protein